MWTLEKEWRTHTGATLPSFRWSAHSCLCLMDRDISQTFHVGCRGVGESPIDMAGCARQLCFWIPRADIWADSECWCRGCMAINTFHLRALDRQSRWPACRPRQTVRDERASHNQRNVLKDRFERVCSDVLEPTAGAHKHLQTIRLRECRVKPWLFLEVISWKWMWWWFVLCAIKNKHIFFFLFRFKQNAFQS